jgi:hypothetical protein
MKAGPLPIHYKRGFLLYSAWLTLAGSALLTFAFIFYTARYAWAEPGVYLGLWAVLLIVTLVVGAVMAPLIERLSRNEPAVVVSAEGIKTRDMARLLPWDEIEKLTTGSATSTGGRMVTTVHVLEICPKDPPPAPAGWRTVVDGHANPLRIAWHLLDEPARLGDALQAHAPPGLLSKSDLAGLPTSR